MLNLGEYYAELVTSAMFVAAGVLKNVAQSYPPVSRTLFLPSSVICEGKVLFFVKIHEK